MCIRDRVATAGLSRPARVALLTGIAGLTAASEVVSFTAVIERTPALHWLDMLGRRPAGPGTDSAGPASAGPPAGQPGPDRAEAPTAIAP